jgi:hypothetical protein
MEFKVFTRGTYFYIIDENEKEYEGLKKDVRVRRLTSNSSEFYFDNINGWTDPKGGVDIANIVKEDGSPYTLAEFIEFKESETGNFNAGGETPQETRTSGLNVFSFVVTNAIEILNSAEFNLFNNTNGIFSVNGTLTHSFDSWDRMNVIDESFIRPDPYLHSEEPYQSIDTDVFVRLSTSFTGGATSVRSFVALIKRRTPANPNNPTAIPDREIEIISSSVPGFSSLQNLPTRSVGANDNFYLFGYGLFIRNISGVTITIPVGGVIRIEFYNKYKKPIIFNSLTSNNI